MGLPRVDDEDGVCWITLDRPETLNALELDDLSALTAAVGGAGPEVDAIVLGGAGGRAFCSGMHQETFDDASPDRAREIISAVGECLAAVRRAPVPTVAMIDGYCLGAAFEMILCCDFRVTTPGSRFGLPEVRLGIPSVVEAALLRHYVGLSMAKEITLTGDLYSVPQLQPFGLFNRVAEADALRHEVVDLLGRLTGLTREVVAAQKGLFDTWMDSGLQPGIDASIDVFATMFEHPATLEALARYRRRP